MGMLYGLFFIFVGLAYIFFGKKIHADADNTNGILGVGVGMLIIASF